ncbi:alpha/beta fold hydrolase [Blastomonas aquatica]|uniref:Alpha/beta hydrolase n=1 Tax=Blastomonas aquatica TaxID=1510276 RepID=A0ABQ1IZE5_9SPHN|nr:alpha/beta hydrolase [Blastomonas aquatica]GGB54260.1 alpha/beta hydrolase [Blastomonas aquatica]
MKKLLRAALVAATLAAALNPPALANPMQSPGTGAAAPSSAQVDRTRFTDTVVGTGPDVILIPGLASPRAVWDRTVEQLQGRYRLHLVQVRGFGDDPGANASGPVLEPFVEDVADYIREAGLKRPAVIGHSMGGLTAAMIAARYPDLLGRVLIEDSLPFIGLIFSPMATVDAVRPQADALLKAALAAGPRAQDPADPTLATMSATEAGRRQVMAWSATADHRVTAQAFHDVLLTDIRPDLGRITTQVTVLYPYDSVVGPVDYVDALYANAYAGLNRVSLKRIDASRHFIMLDQPERFAAAVDSFLLGYGE